MDTVHLTAIILAAGFSSRMGRFKPLLPLGKGVVVERVVGLYRQAGIRDIVVVIGHKGNDLRAVLEPHEVRCVMNSGFEQGMFSSILAGVRNLPEDCHGFFIHPVDIPLVRCSTLSALIAGFEGHPAHIIHPTFAGRRGHPPLVPVGLARPVLEWRKEGGLRAFWASRKFPEIDVPVADQGIMLDMDTETDYRQMLTRLEKEDVPTPPECRALMTQVVAVPEPVQKHCRAVAAVAARLVEVLSQAGLDLDIDLVRAAALVHDIARVQADHAAAGAELLTGLGYPGLADIVRVHMDMAVDARRPPDEAGIVFLADKLVVGDCLADLQTRFDRKMAKYGTYPEAAEAIMKRRDAAIALQGAVERLTGKRMAAILADLDTAVSHDDL